MDIFSGIVCDLLPNITFGNDSLAASQSARNLGVSFDSMIMDGHIKSMLLIRRLSVR